MKNGNNAIQISVIVCTYNSDYSKLIKTIDTILCQKNINLEVIITDDGSEVNHFDELREYFFRNNFEAFKLTKNSQNEGTVKNCLNGLKIASGEYVKFISPGDFFYDEHTFEKLYEFLHNGNYKVAFGKAVYYSVDDKNNVSIHNYGSPRNTKCYEAQNYDFDIVKKSILIYKDWISGAILIMKKEVALHYLQLISGKITYAEDLSVGLIVADNIKIGFWDDYLIWYEYGSGISTSNSEKWQARLNKDQDELWKILNETKTTDSIVKKACKLQSYNKIKQPLIKKFLRTILEPSLLFYHFKRSNERPVDIQSPPNVLLLKKILDIN
ncbi:putative glycosyl transferase [Clostridium sp. N3C]|uniref:glycosyltransferase family 2 protein n=1 Tax=Clostridium sp. N3C TaxID=1776758 RepID=UPI00092E028D|nr:glycosyltransferase family 2 protein [Clostridium sp. N3C]SCN23724.1 putative glycosyl transferase [Clostridium sp. N3C]